MASSSTLRRVLPCALSGGLIGYLARDLGLAGSASAWLVMAIVGAFLCAGRRRAALATVASVLAALWVAVAFTPLTARLAQGLVRVDAPESVDAVVVMGSRIQADGEPTAIAQSRLLHGLELLAEGHAPRLIVTELAATPSAYARLARALSSRLGLHIQVVGLGPVYRTHDEAWSIAAVCRQRGWRRVLMVTSPLHSRRAAASLERQGLRVLSSPAIETMYDLERLDRPAERLLAFAAVVHERLGLFYYARRGWI